MTPQSRKRRRSPIASTNRSEPGRRRTRAPLQPNRTDACRCGDTPGGATAMLTPSEAEALIGEQLACLPIESLPLAQCAGAILRENVYAERDQPPFDRVAMDGIALQSAAVRRGARRYPIQAVQAAGDPPLTLGSSESCIEVMTGAVLPEDCDAVIPVEQIETREGCAELPRELEVAPWQNVHRRGSDTRQGTLLLESGTRLSVPEIAIAASAGMARIRVSAQPAL